MLTEILTSPERRFEEEVQILDPFDACVWLGRPLRSRRVYEDVAALRESLAKGPVRRFLVSHTMGELYDARRSNDTLAKALQKLPGTYGVMTLLPPCCEDSEDIRAYIDRNLRRGLRMARVFPKSHRYSLRIPSMRVLLSALEEKGVPLAIQIGQTGWDEVGGLAQAHPRLAILVESHGHHEYLNMRHALPWLESSANLYVPTNRQFLCGGLELLVERLGPARVFFASNQPLDDPNAGLGPLVFSELPIAVRRQVAHGNLERFLGLADPGRPPQ